MKRLSFAPPVWRRGFTLVEMLVVITIIVLIMAMATPALTRTMQSSRLDSAGQSLLGSIAEAQQTAFSSNTPVEMRFFSYKDTLDQAAMYHSYQLFKVTAASQGQGAAAVVTETVVPVGSLMPLPEGITIPTDNTLTGAFYVAGSPGGGLQDTRVGAQVGYSGVSGATYNAIRFMPDGTCRNVGQTNNGLATLTFQTLQQNFITLTYSTGAAVTLSSLPSNFFTIQIDPFTGKARTYRPGF